MYARRIKDKTYTFRVSGKLWGDSLVMEDLESKSLWSHILGTAMGGPLKGTELETIPSVITSWKSWKEDHPQTTVTVFKRTAGGFTSAMMHRAVGFTVGLEYRDEEVSYPLPILSQQVVINDIVGKDPLLVCFDKVGTGVTIYRRTLDKEVLKFTFQDGQLSAGGSHWSTTTGVALDGPYEGKQLEPLPAIISFADAWQRFHPDGRVYGKK